MTWALLLALALLPAIPLEQISDVQLSRARDRWLLGLLTVGITAVAWAGEIWLALGGLWFLWHWRGPKQLGPLVTWTAIGATWFAARALPRDLFELLPWGWIVVGLVHLIPAARQWAAKGEDGPIRGWMGQRTILGAFLAIVWPFAPGWLYPAFAAGLWLTGPSWLAGLSMVAGAAILWPWSFVVTGPLTLLLAAVIGFSSEASLNRWIEHTPRGKSLDTIRARWNCWRMLGAEARRTGHWRWGAGPGTMPKMLRRLNARHHPVLPPLDQNLGDAHNEPLHFAIEYGVIGMLAMLAFALRGGVHLALGDPWSAAAVTGLVLALASIPCRVAPLGLTWLVVCAGVIR